MRLRADALARALKSQARVDLEGGDQRHVVVAILGDLGECVETEALCVYNDSRRLCEGLDSFLHATTDRLVAGPVGDLMSSTAVLRDLALEAGLEAGRLRAANTSVSRFLLVDVHGRWWCCLDTAAVGKCECQSWYILLVGTKDLTFRQCG